MGCSHNNYHSGIHSDCYSQHNSDFCFVDYCGSYESDLDLYDFNYHSDRDDNQCYHDYGDL